MSQLIGTAIHEAGHTIMAIKFKKDFEYVTIIPKEDALGYILFKEGVNIVAEDSEELFNIQEIESAVRKENTIKLGGYLAEKKLGIDNTIGAKSDFENCVTLALDHLGDGDYSTLFIDECLLETEKLINEYWDSIKIIAQKLIEHKTLNQVQVLSFLGYY